MKQGGETGRWLHRVWGCGLCPSDSIIEESEITEFLGPHQVFRILTALCGSLKTCQEDLTKIINFWKDSGEESNNTNFAWVDPVPGGMCRGVVRCPLNF